MKGAIYARFSSDNQRDESIDAQVRACEEYAKRNDIQIVKIYADRADIPASVDALLPKIEFVREA